jgi:acetyl-CoA carboxylase biotin carboxylase subunit
MEAGVPVIPGTAEAVSGDDVLSVGEKIGYPILVKAASGGGGRGIRAAHSPHELLQATQVAEREARAAFGDGSVYLERQLENPRHVEVQVLADRHGNVVHLYERECSIQRRRQKLIEEAPSLALVPETRRAMMEAAVRLCQFVGYSSAGTVEFLVEGRDYYFLEMNTRIQVEHAVTEVVTAIDLVREQIRVAYGEALGLCQKDIRLNGWALEFRINAEDPDNHFYPSPGRIIYLENPGGPGVRVDSALYEGYVVQPYYDSLISKLVVWDATRDRAILRARRALWEYQVKGIKTTLPLHRRVVYDDVFLSGEYHTGYLQSPGLFHSR